MLPTEVFLEFFAHGVLGLENNIGSLPSHSNYDLGGNDLSLPYLDENTDANDNNQNNDVPTPTPTNAPIFAPSSSSGKHQQNAGTSTNDGVDQQELNPGPVTISSNDRRITIEGELVATIFFPQRSSAESIVEGIGERVRDLVSQIRESGRVEGVIINPRMMRIFSLEEGFNDDFGRIIQNHQYTVTRRDS